MCGIVGYIGNQNAAPHAHRGPVPAGVPGVRLGRDRGPGRPGRPGFPQRRPGPRPRGFAAPAPGRQGGHRAHPVGHARPRHRGQRPPADQRGRADQRRAQRHHRQRGRAARAPGRPGGEVHLRDRHRGDRPPGGPLRGQHPGGRGPRRAVPDHRDVRHRRPRRAAPGPACGRAQRLPADPGRRRPRDVRGQRPRRAGPAHHVRRAPGRRRAGHGDRVGVPHVQPGARRTRPRSRPASTSSSRTWGSAATGTTCARRSSSSRPRSSGCCAAGWTSGSAPRAWTG